MRLAEVRIPRLLALTGSAYLAAILVLVASKTPLGSPLFFSVAVVAATAYALMLARVWHENRVSRPLLYAAFALAVMFRIPPALAPVGPDSDMVRYLWDGRVQVMGYNPYSIVPSDPLVAHTHTYESARMPSRRARTPYPPAAQLFFRLVVSIHDSTLAMKLALVGCDLLTLIVLLRWLQVTGRREWLALAYAWNPLVILEVAHSGHIDALGALWITASAYWLTRQRTALATVAFVLAIGTKLLPVVLAPLFIGRIRLRDALLGSALLATLYLRFTYGMALPLGAVPNVVAHVRFNGPLFRLVAWTAQPEAAALLALIAGSSASLCARRQLGVSDPGAWAWPMAIALVCAPVVYPWYLLYLTPFLFTFATLPLTAWSFSVLLVYIVWHLARTGGRWMVPAPVAAIEYGVLVVATLWTFRPRGSRRRAAS